MQATPAATGIDSRKNGSDSGNVSESKELKLPDISLSELPESTKDYLIAYSATGRSVTEAIKDTLNKAAADAGFPANPQAA